ncbi:MAG: HrcA family transcriptional regulator [Proteobacteria bacterium]|nr:MAG: HrcA family transcriptional regulator [Pseudomonadota bacterium]
MLKKNKRDIILEEIIKAYLEENLPIGSSLLNERMGMQIPASTIRVYFKKLSQEGVLTQLHVSSGRIPTRKAMKGYWLRHLDAKEPVFIKDPENFSKIVEDFGLYCSINTLTAERLDEIIEVKGRYLLLILGDEQIVLKYDENLALFLEQIKGASLWELKQISLQVGLHELSEKIDYLVAAKVLFKKGERFIFEMRDENNLPFYIDDSFALKLDEGVFFDEVLPSGYMALKTPAIFKGEKTQLFCLGELYTDFESFLRKTKENT